MGNGSDQQIGARQSSCICKIFAGVLLLGAFLFEPDSAIGATPGLSQKDDHANLSTVEAELKHVQVTYSTKSGKALQQPALSKNSVAVLEAALAQHPRDPRAHLLAARYYERLGIMDQSQKEYESTVDCLGDKDAVLNLAKQLLHEGNIWYAGRLLDAVAWPN